MHLHKHIGVDCIGSFLGMHGDKRCADYKPFSMSWFTTECRAYRVCLRYSHNVTVRSLAFLCRWAKNNKFQYKPHKCEYLVNDCLLNWNSWPPAVVLAADRVRGSKDVMKSRKITRNARVKVNLLRYASAIASCNHQNVNAMYPIWGINRSACSAWAKICQTSIRNSSFHQELRFFEPLEEQSLCKYLQINWCELAAESRDQHCWC